MAALLNSVVGLGLVALSVYLLGQYGWGLFVGIPFAMGLSAALLHGYHGDRSLWGSLSAALLSVALLGAVVLAVAMEGVVCIAMAAPLGLLLAAMGGLLGHFLQRDRWASERLASLLLLVALASPAMMGAQARLDPEPAIMAVRTAVEIAAPPERVWARVIAFPPLPEPTEALFRLGIAYPLRAEIQGKGVGAVRRCVFSTGAFVEPVTVWDAPRLLHFSVSAQPVAMKELSPYRDLHAPHLEGFFASREGEFRLEALPGGRTRLEGTTWYRDALWPQAYWQAWSDPILHRIHLRVLEHIKALAEADRRAEADHRAASGRGGSPSGA